MVGPTLDAAARNFSRAGGRSQGLLGAVLLTQAAHERVFETLAAVRSVDGWAFASVPEEPETLIAHRDASAVAIVCGRQVRAADGLEVLALGTLDTFPEGMPLLDAMAAVRASGALTVMPWGFGKWLGERGRRVEAALQSLGPEVVFVGDNGSRLAWLGVPSLVRESAQRGFRVLPGTDPFPLAGGHRQVGGFGFLAELEPRESAPWRGLRAWLLARKVSPPAYGSATGPIRFVFNQVGIQFYNRAMKGRNG